MAPLHVAGLLLTANRGASLRRTANPGASLRRTANRSAKPPARNFADGRCEPDGSDADGRSSARKRPERKPSRTANRSASLRRTANRAQAFTSWQTAGAQQVVGSQLRGRQLRTWWRRPCFGQQVFGSQATGAHAFTSRQTAGRSRPSARSSADGTPECDGSASDGRWPAHRCRRPEHKPRGGSNRRPPHDSDCPTGQSRAPRYPTRCRIDRCDSFE